MTTDNLFFPDFDTVDLTVNAQNVHGVFGGVGPALLLLHGYPQTHVMWHKVAPILAKNFTVVAPDLIGYGDSGNPETDAHHTPYSKRSMANTLVSFMAELGHPEFAVVGHDRGGRVAHRMAVDHESVVNKLSVLDIAPTREMYANTDVKFAKAYWHWFYLIQPAPFPENMILRDTDAYVRHKCKQAGANAGVFDPDAFEAYLHAFRRPENVHSSCEDYRAAASIDLEHDDEDVIVGRKVSCPMQALWGEEGVIEACFEAISLWRERAISVEGQALPGGHYLAEQHPELVATELIRFLCEA